MPKKTRTKMLQSAFGFFLLLGAVGLYANALAQKTGTPLYGENITRMTGTLSGYQEASATGLRTGGLTQCQTNRASAISTFLQSRAGVSINQDILASTDTRYSVDTLADQIVEHTLDRIQNSDPKQFVTFLRLVNENKAGFFFMTEDGKATVLSSNELMFGIAYARKSKDRAMLKTLALPKVRGAVQTSAAYFSKASEEFARETNNGQTFSAPEAILIAYTVLSSDYATVAGNPDGRKLYGVGGTANQFPVEFLINNDFAKRVATGK